MLISQVLECAHDIGQIDVIDIWVKNDTDFNHLFIYENCSSKFKILKALKTNSIKEIAEQFLHVIRTIGAPLVLQSPKGKDFVNEVIETINCKVITLPIICDDNSFSKESTRDVKDLLDSWLLENPSKSWLEGIEVVQVIVNETCEMINQNAEAQMRNGCKTLDSLHSVDSNDSTEEQWYSAKENSITNALDSCTFYVSSDSPDILIDRDVKLELVNTSDPAVPPASSVDSEKTQSTAQRSMLPSNENTVDALPEPTYQVVTIDDIPIVQPYFLNESAANIDDVLTFLEKSAEEARRDKRFDCNVCKRKCGDLGDLEKHMKTHNLSDMYSCQKCFKCFNVLRHFNDHIRSFHPEIVMSTVSKVLAQSRESKVPLKSVRVELEDVRRQLKRNETASEVGANEKSGKKQIGPQPTIIVASDKKDKSKRFKCKHCSEAFAYPSYLKRHLLSHSQGLRCVGKFECKTCDKVFNNPKYLKLHERSHATARPRLSETSQEARPHQDKKEKLKCEHCDETFLYPSNLERHVRSHQFGHRRVRVLKCDDCDKTFQYPSYLKRHMRTHTKERPFCCRLCNKRFLQSSHLSHHLFVHIDYRSKQCADCLVTFDSLKDLIVHSRKHDGILKFLRNLYECEVCKKIFKSKGIMERHMLTHTQQKPFQCNVCNRAFRQKANLRGHMSIHNKEMLYKCEVCGKAFNLKKVMEKHVLRHTDIKPHLCKLCGAGFLEKRNLHIHLRAHTFERPYTCTICQKSFALKSTLCRHIQSIHNTAKTHQCEICGKTFKQSFHLSVHKKTHSSDSPYQCPDCPKSYKYKALLRSHQHMHFESKQYNCHDCGMFFRRKSNLRVHISAVHKRLRPYQCSECLKKFKQKSHLNVHMRVHSPARPYQCGVCGKRCNRSDNLKKHMRIHQTIAVIDGKTTNETTEQWPLQW